MRSLFFLLLVAALMSCKNKKDDPTPDPNFVYFLVGEVVEEHGDSFILALKDEDDIAMARAIIAGTESQKIVLAEITKDKSLNFYHNKDLNRDITWSWHIAAFLGFYDNTIEIYDGWPQYVEDHYDEWVQNTKSENDRGVIGFWSYTVVREVSASELK